MSNRNRVLLIYAVTIIATLFVYFVFTDKASLPNKYVQKPDALNQMPQAVNPNSLKQIGCSGDPTYEFKKRNEKSIGYDYGDTYVGLNNDVWDPDDKASSFNKLNPEWLSQLQTLSPPKTSVPARALLAQSSMLNNYVEQLDYRPFEIDVRGSGYFLFDNGPYIVMSGSKNYREKTDYEPNSGCFDDRSREVILSIGGTAQYPALANASNNKNRILFDKFAPSECTAFSFLVDDKSFFVYCKSDKLSSVASKGILFGFSVVKEQNPNEPGKSIHVIVPTLVTSIEQNAIPSKTSIVRSGPNKYFVLSGPHLYKIEPDTSGKLALQKLGFSKSPTTDAQINFINEKMPNAYMPYAFLYFFDTSKTNFNYEVVPFDVAVINLETGASLDVDKTGCIVETPDDFYNRTLDPFYGSGYKSLQFEYVSSNHIKMTQESSNAGVLTKEGSMDIYLKDDKVTCVGKIDGTQTY